MKYRNIHILGGHKLALSYCEILQKARDDGEISFENISTVAKNSSSFILDMVSTKEKIGPDDVIVPDHTAKHVFLQVFMDMVKKKFPKLKTSLTPFQSDFDPPYLHFGDGGALWAMSYATWICPSECEEPGICPHIKGPRDWDFEKSLGDLFKKFPPEKFSIHRFACRQLWKYIACISFTKIADEIQQFVSRLKKGETPTVIIVTHSHCHAILGQFEVNYYEEQVPEALSIP